MRIDPLHNCSADEKKPKPMSGLLTAQNAHQSKASAENSNARKLTTERRGGWNLRQIAERKRSRGLAIMGTRRKNDDAAFAGRIRPVETRTATLTEAATV